MSEQVGFEAVITGAGEVRDAQGNLVVNQPEPEETEAKVE